MKQARNLLFITTDQQRSDSMPCYGLSFMRRGGVDRLAAMGTVYDRCYTTAPLCVPSRASLLTGCYPNTLGVLGNNDWFEEGWPLWPEILTQAGFETCSIGKMHVFPWDWPAGFTQRIIAEDKRHYYRHDDYTAFLRTRGFDRYHPKDVPGYFEGLGAFTSPLPLECHIDAYTGSRAVEWLENRSPEYRFALWVSFAGPHDPYDPPAGYAGIYDDSPIPAPVGNAEELKNKPSQQRESLSQLREHPLYLLDHSRMNEAQIRKIRSNYLANVTLISDKVNEMLAALETRGLLDDTLVIFTSDHGDALGDHGLLYKSYFYESMARVPLVIAGPGCRAGTRSAVLVQHMDVVPFFLEHLGVKSPPMQAQSFGSQNPEGRDCVFSECEGRAMAADASYKYVAYRDGQEELYDLTANPGETINLADESSYQVHLQRLKSELVRHLLQCAAFASKKHDQGRDEQYTEYMKKLAHND